MILIVGLGNPGEQFKNTRHNVGREIVADWQKKAGLADFELNKKFKALVSKNKKAVLLLPETFMNKSGNAVGPAARLFKVKTKQIFVVHDDADLPLGHAKLSFGKHSAGHKGVESVMRVLKTRDFWRFRIGIAARRDIPAEKLVLKKWAPEEVRLVRKIIKKTASALEEALTRGPEQAMNNYNH
ncbi:MAG: aminoacyl-tRNA hydrolase [Candidatus Sungiibacteriota bacterium]|uniref:Aminoacyl-tRNA hydrolase n=1 Tax=Candidatus Sungiibacteriota bacterium TaxID=2750080 RepID=A0A7T5UR10_9BACT|nr:MAG: aminoacyl-tRNA hydrolase [Candidatus Sungbacteria bacterium]